VGPRADMDAAGKRNISYPYQESNPDRPDLVSTLTALSQGFHTNVLNLIYLHHRIQTGSGAHPASNQWVPGAFSLRVKRPGREADYSPLSSAEIKITSSYTSTPRIRLHGVLLS
jgi:hypothetical protein